jgi:hypothetical protein
LHAASVALAALLCAGSCPAQDTAQRKHWFDDPFFAISNDAPDCPVPLGPLLTGAERRTQAHHRAERGTSCWLAGQCDRPNAYAYDHDIAQTLRDALSRRAAIPKTSLWVTVQRRIVFTWVYRPVRRRGLQRVGRRCKRPEHSQLIAVRAARRSGPRGPAASGAYRTAVKRPDRQGRPVDTSADRPLRSGSPALNGHRSSPKTATSASSARIRRPTSKKKGV